MKNIWMLGPIMRNGVFLLLFSFVFTACDDSSAVPDRFDNFFIKYYGGSGDHYGEDIISTSDGGYIAVGTSDPDRSIASGESLGLGPQDEDIFVVKTDARGNEEWSRAIDFNGLGRSDFGKGILEIAGGYLIVGNSGDDGFYIQTDITGNPTRQVEIDRGGKEEFENVSVVNNGFLIVGNTDNPVDPDNQDGLDYLSILLDANLDTVAWPNEIVGVAANDYGIRGFQSSSDPNQLFVLGYTDDRSQSVANFDNNSFVLQEFVGTTVGVNRLYGGLEDQICSDAFQGFGEYHMIGTQDALDMYYVRFLESGTQQVQVATTVFTGLFSTLEGVSISTTSDNQLVAVGNATYIDGDQDIFLGKFSPGGTAIWSHTFGSTDQQDAGGKVFVNPDGTIVFTGSMNLSGQRKLAIIKTNSEGQLK